MAHPVSPPLTHDIALHCDDELGRPMAFMATFDYAASDPYAVGMTFHVPAGDLPWVLDRRLLHRGLTEPAGGGVVRLAPGIDDDGHAVVRITCHSPEGRLQVAARTVEVLQFLVRTWRLVPAGDETSQLDLDTLVEQLRS